MHLRRTFGLVLTVGLLVLAICATAAGPRESPPASPEDSFPYSDTVRTVAGQFDGISLVALYMNMSVGSIFDELGAPDASRWRLGRWNPSTSGYVTAGGGLTSVAFGQGYWLVTRDAERIGYKGELGSLDSIEVPLFRGPNGLSPAWNQLGNPFTFALNPANVAIIKRDSLYSLKQLENTFTETEAKVWNPATQAYGNATTIGRGSAFWVRVRDADTTARWTIWPVNNSSSPGLTLDMAVDATGKPHIGWMSSDAGFIHDLRRGLGYIFYYLGEEALDDQRCSIAMAPDSTPRVAYAGSTSQGTGLVYGAFSNQTGWSTELVDGTYSAGTYSSMACDANGVPHILYNGDDYSHLKYATKRSGTWTIELVDLQWSFECEMALSASGIPHVAYVGYNLTLGHTELRYATRVGTSWASDVVDTLPGFGLAFALDPQGGPHVVYVDEGGDLAYASKSGGVWSSQPIGGGVPGRRPSLVFDRQGNPHVSYFDSGTPRLRYARRIGGTWLIETVDNSITAGQLGTSLVRAPDGHPMIAYFGGTNGTQIRLAEKTRGDVRAKFPATFIITGQAPGGNPEATPATADAIKPEGAEWALEISARVGDHAAEPVVVGAWSQAREHPTHARIGQAPAPPGLELPTLAIVDDEPGVVHAPLTRALVTPAARMPWTLELSSGVAASDVVLSFRGADLPADLRLWVEDDLQGWAREVKSGGSLTIAAGTAPRRLRLVAARGTEPSLAHPTSGLEQVIPNPFRTDVGLVFALDQPADVRVEVFDLQGRLVRRIDENAAGVGEHVVRWDGRDAQGRPVRSGIYLARWTAGSATGTTRTIKLGE